MLGFIERIFVVTEDEKSDGGRGSVKITKVSDLQREMFERGR